MKTLNVIGLVVAGIIALSVAGCAFQIIGGATSTTANLVTDTFNSQNIRTNYEWFHRQYQDIGSFDVRITNARNTLQGFSQNMGDSFEDRQERNRLNSVVLGLENQRAQMVAEYNSRASMVNRNIFRSGNLPEQMN